MLKRLIVSVALLCCTLGVAKNCPQWLILSNYLNPPASDRDAVSYLAGFYHYSYAAPDSELHEYLARDDRVTSINSVFGLGAGDYIYIPQEKLYFPIEYTQTLQKKS